MISRLETLPQKSNWCGNERKSTLSYLARPADKQLSRIQGMKTLSLLDRQQQRVTHYPLPKVTWFAFQ